MTIYKIDAPIPTHFRPATCQEVECQAYAWGWVTKVDESSHLGASQADYIRHHSGRAFTENKDSTGLTMFTFASEQRCFAPHVVRLEREATFRARGEILTPESWVESMETDFDAERHRRGEG